MKKLFLHFYTHKKLYGCSCLLLIVFFVVFFKINIFRKEKAFTTYSSVEIKPKFIGLFPNLFSPDEKFLAFQTWKPQPKAKRKIRDDVWFLDIESRKILASSPNDMLRKSLCPFINARDATWSSDSKEIAFSFHNDFDRDREKQKICIFDLATGRTKYLNIKKKFKYETFPAWSPTGREIAFLGKEEYKEAQLFLYNLKTATLRQLTDKTVDPIPLTWSSNGHWLLFCRDKKLWKKEISTGYEECLTTSDSNIRYIQTCNKNIFFVSIEPSFNQLMKETRRWLEKKKTIEAEGKKFKEPRPMYTLKVWKTDLTGAIPRLISSFKTIGSIPVVSSSGSAIVIALSDLQGSNYHIWKYSITTGDLQQLTFEKTNDTSPIWLAGEDRIIFNRNSKEIWIMNSNGTNQRQILPTK